MALALTPAVLAVAESSAHSPSESLAGRLWPGLAAVAGLLLLLNQPSLADPAADLILVLAPLLTGLGAVLFCSARSGRWRLPAALVGASVALGLGAAVSFAFTRRTGLTDMAGLAAGLDAAEALLSLLALQRLSTIRWAAQFSLVPLVVLLEGALFFPSSLRTRACVGLGLLALASIAQLLPPSENHSLHLGASAGRPPRTDG
jgi:threonine/homoserine efflux transporter RhtA